MFVAVLGASPNKDRYSNRALHQLLAHGHHPLPVHPTHEVIDGLAVRPSLAQITDPIDTITVYVGPEHIAPLIPQIIAAKPRRVILNPGAESPALEAALTAAGIAHLRACTLVMLATGQF